MTDEQKGALLLARHEGKAIESTSYHSNWEWIENIRPSFVDACAYRIKPSEPVITSSTSWRDKVTGKITRYIPDMGGVEKGTRTITTLDGVCIKDEWVADTKGDTK